MSRVVKEGSKIFSRWSLRMPMTVSRTLRLTHEPGLASGEIADAASPRRWSFSVRYRRPPRGIASRALMQP